MARISKSGLDYFPLDVNFLQDRKVRRISSRHHAAGIAALTSLFCLIYKEKGYYVPWNQDTLFDVAQEACCEEAEMQAIIDDCLAVGLFDPHIYKVYSVLTSQVIQEQYHKIITDSRRKYKLPLEHFWLITDGETEQQKDEYGKENSIAKSENENRNGNRAGTGNGTVSDAAVNDIYATKTGINAVKSPEIATTIPQTKEETDTKGKQETEKERDRGTETKAERDREKEIEKDKETENRRKAGKETENEMPPVPSNGVFQAPPVVVSGLSFGNFGNSSEIKECYSEVKGKYSINSLVYWVTYVHNVVYSFYRSMIYCYINSTQRCAGSIVIDIIPTNGADKRKFFPFAPYFPVTNVIKRYFYPYFPAIIGIKGYSFPYFPYLSGIMKIKTALYSLFSRLDWHKTVVFPCLGEIYEGIRSLSWEIPVT